MIPVDDTRSTLEGKKKSSAAFSVSFSQVSTKDLFAELDVAYLLLPDEWKYIACNR
jgi:hypothetical protein